MEHSELPADGAACSGLQLWVNLPREKKGVAPSYQDATRDDLPTESTDGATVTTVVGEGSPLDLHTPVEYVDVRLSDEWDWVLEAGWNGFLYVVAGEGRVDGHSLRDAQSLVVTDGGTRTLSTSEGLRVAAIAGRPHDEPIRQRGPFVD
jgi:redox-sensitive bicupin YhaK (pirin superfamily)